MKANELKRAQVIQVDGQIILIKQVQVQSPSSRSGSTIYKVSGKNVVNRQKFERNYKGDDVLIAVDFTRRPVQLLYRDAERCTFMDSESYEQYVINSELIDDELKYINEGLEGISALIADEVLLGIELPASVALSIIECPPAIKGASASARTKPATLITGLIVQVPEYLDVGDVIRINTESGHYIARA